MARKVTKQDALDYHSKGRPGKLEIIPSKETKTQHDLALAYSPGVAEPCLEIQADVSNVYKYTSKGNLVAVISNGTAVLGLGDIGPEASKPVMEGKSLLFKIYADIDSIDIELDEKDPDKFIAIVKALQPTFGGINLEDIKSPDCFYIEEQLKASLNIPIMHDDQHGTAIISAAALLNALEIKGKKIEEVKLVMLGAGAAAVSCAKIYIGLGLKKENLIMVDSKGVIHAKRDDLDKIKEQFITQLPLETLDDAIVGADVFVGLSKANMFSAEQLLKMAKNPIVFALANPNPEIAYDLAMQTREDIIFATGRSDYPNQVNNVLGFPYIFRGALDVQATQINEAMKLAAVRALADLAKESVPDVVNLAYGENTLSFGKNYIIPKPMDPRLLITVTLAVAKAAVESGVARKPIQDWDQYLIDLYNRRGKNDTLMRIATERAKAAPKRIVFAEADNAKILKSVVHVKEEGIAIPILLGNKVRILKKCEDLKINIDGIQIIDPKHEEMDEKRNEYGKIYFQKRQRKGVNLFEACKAMRDRNYFGAMMVEQGEADAFISGMTRNYSEAIKPALQIIGTEENVYKIAGMYLLLTNKGPIFFSDTTINVNPTAEDLVSIVELTARNVREFNIVPRIALLSYSNFGAPEGEDTIKIRNAVAMLKKRNPTLIVDGDVQANMAFDKELLEENYPFSELLKGSPNTLIFPNLAAGNISYKLLNVMGAGEAIGPILMGMKKPVHILQLGSSVREIVNMVTIAVIDAQVKAKRKTQA